MNSTDKNHNNASSSLSPLEEVKLPTTASKCKFESFDHKNRKVSYSPTAIIHIATTPPDRDEDELEYMMEGMQIFETQINDISEANPIAASNYIRCYGGGPSVHQEQSPVDHHLLLHQVFKLFKLFQSCFKVDNEILIASLIYTDRILEMNQDWLIIDDINGKGMLLTALALAAKFFLDRFESHTLFHILIGDPYHKRRTENKLLQTLAPQRQFMFPKSQRRRMRMMQAKYLELIDFRLNICEEEYSAMMSRVKSMIATKFASRGQVVILDS